MGQESEELRRKELEEWFNNCTEEELADYVQYLALEHWEDWQHWLKWVRRQD
jgi:hypothetical protein